MKRYVKAQAAIEYLILLGVVTAIALAGFARFLPKTRDLAIEVYNETTMGVVGDSALPIGGDLWTGKARSYVTNYP